MPKAPTSRTQSNVHDVPVLDISTPNVARMYDYFLGGKDHYAADREAAARVLEAVPATPVMARANRAFLGQAVRFLATHAGIGQFLDIGTGLPTRENVHEIAHEVNPEANVVYVDHDPVVLVHARALLATNTRTHVIWGDLREPEWILNAAGEFADLDKPLAILLVAVLHFIPDDEQPHRVVKSLMDAVAPGSYLVISHAERTRDLLKAAKAYDRANARVALRSAEEIGRFFDGLDMIGPGLVRLPQWSPGDPDETSPAGLVSIYDQPVIRDMPILCGVGRKS